MKETTWGDVEKRYREAEDIGAKYNWDFDDFEAEQDGSVDTWVRITDAAYTVASLEQQLAEFKRLIFYGVDPMDLAPKYQKIYNIACSPKKSE
jgi:hypothetical protein